MIKDIITRGIGGSPTVVFIPTHGFGDLDIGPPTPPVGAERHSVWLGKGLSYTNGMNNPKFDGVSRNSRIEG